METKTFTVPNIGCEGCVNTVERELLSLNGVQSARAEEQSKQVTVTFAEPASWPQIVDVLTAIDYPPAQA